MYLCLKWKIYSQFVEKDLLSETFRFWAKPGSREEATSSYDERLQRYYGERYDNRSNVVDWDYHIKVQAVARSEEQGVTVCPEVIQFHEFRRWRLSGVAFELRDCVQSQANRCGGVCKREREKLLEVLTPSLCCATPSLLSSMCTGL